MNDDSNNPPVEGEGYETRQPDEAAWLSLCGEVLRPITPPLNGGLCVMAFAPSPTLAANVAAWGDDTQATLRRYARELDAVHQSMKRARRAGGGR